jgi:hypothetical protein
MRLIAFFIACALCTATANSIANMPPKKSRVGPNRKKGTHKREYMRQRRCAQQVGAVGTADEDLPHQPDENHGIQFEEADLDEDFALARQIRVEFPGSILVLMLLANDTFFRLLSNEAQRATLHLRADGLPAGFVLGEDEDWEETEDLDVELAMLAGVLETECMGAQHVRGVQSSLNAFECRRESNTRVSRHSCLCCSLPGFCRGRRRGTSPAAAASLACRCARQT